MKPLMTIEDEAVFVFRPGCAQAIGTPVEGRAFKVFAGSTAVRSGTPRKKRDENYRDRLLGIGVLAPDTDPRLYRFEQDFIFDSASRAAGIIKDGNASGPQLWKNERTGRTLKDHLDKIQKAT